MNPFKINQSLTFNIYALSGYLIALIHIVLFWYSQVFIIIYIGFAIIFAYYYIFYFLSVLLCLFFIEIIFRKKILWRFNTEYKHNKLALCYFWIGILLNLVVYYITYKLIEMSRCLITS